MISDAKEVQLLLEISEKLDRLIGVVAIQGKDQDTQIGILADLGLDAPAIGSLVGISANAVRIRKSRGKKKLARVLQSQ